MEFTIGQNASLPVLKMQVVNDGTQNFESMMEFIERSSIFFSMVSTDNGIPKVYTKSAGFVEKLEMDENASPEYYVYYRFTAQDTSRIGRYEGQFMFINEDGTLVGTLTEIIVTGANDVYVITPNDGSKDLLIPAIKSVIKKIDIESRQMIIAPQEWDL